MTDIYDEMYHLRNQRDAATLRAEKAEAEADRLHAALVRIGYSVAGAHPEAMRKIARTALDAKDGDE